MVNEGASRKAACARVYLMDVDGLVTTKRHPMENLHIPYAKDMPHTYDLLEASIYNDFFGTLTYVMSNN
ncbi:unnamed protein product [Gongylonema pulchrum]|uniref:Malic_M domain-containing protein n=1 Tax=Gongylonema pulchrum TaxID=637853 RepID=A0A183DLF2_9BILA|nr:unnamed protein product [Gongylonema pulchrum]